MQEPKPFSVEFGRLYAKYLSAGAPASWERWLATQGDDDDFPEYEGILGYDMVLPKWPDETPWTPFRDWIPRASGWLPASVRGEGARQTRVPMPLARLSCSFPAPHADLRHHHPALSRWALDAALAAFRSALALAFGVGGDGDRSPGGGGAYFPLEPPLLLAGLVRLRGLGWGCCPRS